LAIAERMRLGFVRNAVLHNLGIVLGRRGRFDEAFAMEREALEAFQADGDKRMESGARAYLAILYGMRGDWERAAEETRQALTLTVSAHPLRLLSLAVHAAAQNALGHRERALELYTEAEPLLASPLGNEEGDALIRLVRAEALAARGELDAARETIRVGKARLLERAAALRDPAMRTTFLQNVPENAQTFALAEAWSV
jgi:tetratricopeptide (TPR) repeat protein